VEDLCEQVEIDLDGKFIFHQAFWEVFNRITKREAEAALKYLVAPWESVIPNTVPCDLLFNQQDLYAREITMPKVAAQCIIDGHLFRGRTRGPQSNLVLEGGCVNCGTTKPEETWDQYFEGIRAMLNKNTETLQDIEPVEMTVDEQVKVSEFIRQYGDVIKILTKVRGGAV